MIGAARRSWSWTRGHPRSAIAFLVMGFVGVAVALFAFEAYRAAVSLQRAAAQAEQLQAEVVAGDGRAARSSLQDLRRSTTRAHHATDGPLWAVGAKLPWLGRNVGAVRAVAATMDEVATRAMPPIVNVSDKLNADAFSPRGGQFDLATVEAIRPAVDEADRSLTAARATLRSVDPDELVGRLRAPVKTLRDKIATAQTSVSSVNVAVHLMPGMLGQGGERRYLLVVQNNAEIRATGGIAGAFAVITASNGRLSVERTGSKSDLPPSAAPVVTMTSDEKSVFTDQLVRDIRDVNVTPDFPRSAEIALELTKRRLGIDVDGVLSIDPVALSYVLTAVGKVEVGHGLTVDASNAVDVLLNDVYREYSSEEQDSVFAGSARKIFDAVTSGSGDPRKLIKGLSLATSQNRLMVWSKRADEQKRLAATGLAGTFKGDDGATPQVGIYLGDGAGGKMQYYLDYGTAVESTQCLVGGRQKLTTTMKLVSDAPSGLPESIAGNGVRAPKGDMRLFAWLYAPYDGRFTSIKLDGVPQMITTARLKGRPETTVEVRLGRGQTRTLSATMISGPGQDADGVFSSTPGIRASPGDVRVPSACR